MGVLRVLGLISGIIGLWDFGDNMFPVNGDGRHSNYKIFIGIDGAANPGDADDCCLVDAGGQLSYAKVYNSQGDDIGHGGMFPSMKSGSEETITVSQFISQQAVTFKVFAETDAVCIAAIAATLHDGTHWGWVGDWGRICGVDWYYSGIKQTQWNDNSPLCTWLDKDHSNGVKAGGMAINWAGFTNTLLPDDGGVSRCGDNFVAWNKEGGDSVITPARDGQHVARGNGHARHHRGFNNDRRLVVSSLPAHSADELCQHPNSRGPSFVSLTEGTHCNMETREVLPLCSEGLRTGCFDLEAETAVVRASSAGGGGGAGSSNTSHVIYW